MSYGYEYDADRGYADPFAADAARDERATFIRKVYAHVGLAVLAFVALCTVFVKSGVGLKMLGLIGGHWWIAIIAFMLVSWVAQAWAHNGTSMGIQYLGLGLYVVAESLIFAPILWVAANMYSPDLLPTAAFLTLFIFGGLTAVVMMTKKDFSFLGPALSVGMLAVLGLIIASLIIGFTLGLVFTVGVIVLMCGFILYETSNVLHHYEADRYVGAALQLFASLATLFWYIIRLLMILSDND